MVETSFMRLQLFINRNYRVLMSVCMSVRLSVCVSVYTITQNNGSITLKLEHIVVYEKKLGRVRHWALSDRGQGHTMTLKFFSIYHNTNCQVKLSIGALFQLWHILGC